MLSSVLVRVFDSLPDVGVRRSGCQFAKLVISLPLLDWQASMETTKYGRARDEEEMESG